MQQKDKVLTEKESLSTASHRKNRYGWKRVVFFLMFLILCNGSQVLATNNGATEKEKLLATIQIMSKDDLAALLRKAEKIGMNQERLLL